MPTLFDRTKGLDPYPWETKPASELTPEQLRELARRQWETGVGTPGFRHTMSTLLGSIRLNPLENTAIAAAGANVLKELTKQLLVKGGLNVAQAVVPGDQRRSFLGRAAESIGVDIDPDIIPVHEDARANNPRGAAAQQALLKLSRIGNALTGGGADLWLSRMIQAMPEKVANPLTGAPGKPASTMQPYTTLAKAAITHGVMDWGPGTELTNLLRGADESGKPLEAKDVWENIISASLKTVPFVAWKSRGGGRSRILEGGKSGEAQAKKAGYLSSKFKDLRSMSEIEKNMEIRMEHLRKLADEKRARSGEGVPGEAPEVIRPTLEDIAGAEAAAEVTPKTTPFADSSRLIPGELLPELDKRLREYQDSGLLSSDAVAQIRAEVMPTRIFRDVTKAVEKADKLNKTDTPITAVIAQSIVDGDMARTSTALRDIATIYGLTDDAASRQLAQALVNTESSSAKAMRAIQDSTIEAYTKLVRGMLKGDHESIRQYMFLRRSKKHSGDIKGLDPGLYSDIAKMERLALSALLSRWATGARNATVQTGQFIKKLLDDAMSGTLEYALRNDLPENARFRTAYSDAFNDLVALGDVLTKATGGRVGTKKWLARHAKRMKFMEDVFGPEGFPLAHVQLYGPSAFEIGMEATKLQMRDVILRPTKFAESLKKFKELGASNVDLLSYGATTAIRLTEKFYRKLFAETEMLSRIEQAGMTMDEFVHKMKNPVLDESTGTYRVDSKLAEIVGGTIQDTLKHTFAWSPDFGVQKWVLDTYKKFPIATAIVTPFPRFTMNAFRWLNDHSPILLGEFFNPEVRALIRSGAKGGWASRDAARMLSRAATGWLMLGTAYQMRTSPKAGPKYYQWETSRDETGKVSYFDSRTDNPFGLVMAFGEVVRYMVDKINAKEDIKPIGMNTREWLELLTSMRRIEDTVFPGLVNSFAMLSEDLPVEDAITKLIATPFGQTIARMAVPFSILSSAVGLVDADNPEWRTQRELRSIESYGPESLVRNELLAPSAQYVPWAQRLLPKRIDPTTGESITTPYKNFLLRETTGVNLQEFPALYDEIQKIPGFQLADVAGRQPSVNATRIMQYLVGQLMNRKTWFPEGKLTDAELMAKYLREGGLSTEKKELALRSWFEELRAIAKPLAMQASPGDFAEDIASTAIDEAIANNTNIDTLTAEGVKVGLQEPVIRELFKYLKKNKPKP